MNVAPDIATDKPSLSFYTNIPAPYQLSFFNALSRYFQLTVIYYSTEQNGNTWNPGEGCAYNIILLKNNFIAKWVQKFIPDFHFSWKIFKTVTRDKSNYVIVSGGYWIPNAAAALVISRLRRKSVYYFSEALFEVTNKIKYFIKKSFLQILNICCTGILCTGKKAAQSFTNFKIKPSKYIVPYNIDVDVFGTLNKEKLAYFNQTYKESNQIIILTSGFLIERKGIDILIKAVKEINYNYKLIILGSGDKLEELQKLSNGNRRIIFAGFQKSEAIPYFYAIADLFVFPSRYDGWGVVINEAIAANVPVISSTKVGAAIELITSGENGILCESENVSAFRDAIELMITDNIKRAQIKVNALQLIPRISSDYNAQYVAQILVKENAGV